jgi:ATP-dependent DNA helicase RecG
VASALTLADASERAAAHDLPVSRARFVDAKRAVALEKIGVRTVGELVRHYPFRYLDLSKVVPLRDIRPGGDVTAVGTVHEVKVKRPRPRLAITEVSIVDGTGVLLGVWFNQPWVQQNFIVGERVAFAGRVEIDYGLKQIKAPFVERLSDEEGPARVGRMLPVHRTTEGLSTGWLRRLVAAAVDDVAAVPDHLPAAVRISRGLVPLAAALSDIHFPATSAAACAARERLAYDELLILQLYMAMRRYALTREQVGIAHRVDGAGLELLRATMPFELTIDQQRATAEILSDMSEPRPMNRMLLGDVGTGKTLVAAHALAAAGDSGGQAAMMAPTEVLATQYAEKVGPLLDAAGVSWRLLTGSTAAAPRREVLGGVADGEVSVLFGTHALLEESVAFKRLTLAIVDEQHRFGVNQRLGLRSKGVSADLLVMTATPIPRSLALTLYGDLATSYLRERPLASSGVTTRLVKPHTASPAHQAVRDAVAAGRQAYVVCALVDESDTAQAKAATREYERLRNEIFPRLRVGLLTGRMRPAEKAGVMTQFRAGEIDVLVATTVIEVGVDVPNATVMLVEDADRFGLSQLHQLRGRVGRGEHPGEVWLISEARSADARARLTTLVETSSGFELAEKDLRLRGEGQVLGDRQHGLHDLRIASLIDDLALVEAARVDAFAIVSADPHLSAPEHGPLLREVKRAYAKAWEWVSSG